MKKQVTQRICDKCGDEIKGRWEKTTLLDVEIKIDRSSQALLPYMKGLGMVNKVCIITNNKSVFNECRKRPEVDGFATNGQHVKICSGKECKHDLCYDCRDKLMEMLGQFFR